MNDAVRVAVGIVAGLLALVLALALLGGVGMLGMGSMMGGMFGDGPGGMMGGWDGGYGWLWMLVPALFWVGRSLSSCGP